MNARISSLSPNNDGSVDITVAFALDIVSDTYMFTVAPGITQDDIKQIVAAEAEVFRSRLLEAQAEARAYLDYQAQAEAAVAASQPPPAPPTPELPAELQPLLGYEIDV